jgi:uncharacterized protein YgfB (UPF0149 family)
MGSPIHSKLDNSSCAKPVASANYMHVVPNSHFWTDLNQIITSFDLCPQVLTKEYLLIGLNNSIKNGYKLKKLKKIDTQLSMQERFDTIAHMIVYVCGQWYNEKTFYTMLLTTLNSGFNITNGQKMERREVYRAIDGERDYQDLRWNSSLREGDVPDEEKPVAEWLNYLEYHLSKAKNENYHLNKDAALDELRKVAALAVRALEIHGCPLRDVTKGNQITLNPDLVGNGGKKE